MIKLKIIYNKFASKHSTSLFIGGFGVLLYLFISFTIPIIPRIIIDNIIKENNTELLKYFIIFVPILLICGAILQYGTNLLFVTVGTKISLEMSDTDAVQNFLLLSRTNPRQCSIDLLF